MEEKDIAYQIGVFLEKYNATNSVELPQTVFLIRKITKVSIEENSILELENMTLFKGKANIEITDGVSSVFTTLNKRNIVGYAKIENVKNYPEVKSLTITKIQL